MIEEEEGVDEGKYMNVKNKLNYYDHPFSRMIADYKFGCICYDIFNPGTKQKWKKKNNGDDLIIFDIGTKIDKLIYTISDVPLNRKV